MDALSEREADKQVIQSLVEALHTIWPQLEQSRSLLQLQQKPKQGTIVMSKVMQDLKGAFYLVEDYEQLTEQVAKEILEHAEHDLMMVKNFLSKEFGNAPAETAQITPGTPAAAPAEQVAIPEAVAQPEQPAAPVEPPIAPVEQAPAPVADPAQTAPVDAPAAPIEQPAAPAVDPNAAPAVDPNQVQTTTPQIQ